MCTISKAFDNLLLKRYECWIFSQLNVLQGVSQKTASSLNTTFLLRQAIGQQDVSYVVLLDVKKAFDTVWIKGLLYKLCCMGMSAILWANIYDSYDNFKCAVNIAGGVSSWFTPLQGIHQGDILSMYLYCLFNNDLITELANIPCGVRIQNKSVAAPSFADDVAVIAKSAVSMQHYLDTVNSHSVKWKYNFNTEKIKILIFGKVNKDMCFTIDGKKLIIVDGYKHLGVPLCSSSNAQLKFIEERVDSLKVSCHMIRSIGSSTGGTSPISASKLYWSVTIPKLLYGCEVWPICEQGMLKLQKAHEYAARTFQGLPQQCPGIAATAALGWQDIECTMDKRRLMFLFTLFSVQLPFYINIFMQTFISFSVTKRAPAIIGPLYILYTTCKKYDIVNFVLSEHLLNPVKISKSTWRNMVLSVVNNKYKMKHSIDLLMYDSLSIFKNCMFDFSILWLWYVVMNNPVTFYKCKVVARMLIGGDAMYRRLLRNVHKHSSICQLCPAYQQITIEHVLFECMGLSGQREVQWERMTSLMPPAMVSSINCMSDSTKLVFLMSGLNVKYLKEWQCIYEGLVTFLCNMNNCLKVAMGLCD